MMGIAPGGQQINLWLELRLGEHVYVTQGKSQVLLPRPHSLLLLFFFFNRHFLDRVEKQLLN